MRQQTFEEGGLGDLRIARGRALPRATPALAQEAGIDILADSTATDQDLWNDATIDWNVDADDFGQRDVVSGDTFSIESMVDVYGNEIGAGDYAVLYADSTGNFTTTNTVDGQIGGMPKRR